MGTYYAALFLKNFVGNIFNEWEKNAKTKVIIELKKENYEDKEQKKERPKRKERKNVKDYFQKEGDMERSFKKKYSA